MSLPVELLVEIACESPQVFKAMLALRPVAEYLRCNRKLVLDRLTRIEIDDDITRYYIGDKLHREDGPAEEYSGNKFWYRNGKLYREGDLPTAEWSSGDKIWHLDGIVHRDGDLPAIIYADGTKYWYRKGKLHRVGKPAIEFANGEVEYWVDDVYNHLIS